MKVLASLDVQGHRPSVAAYTFGARGDNATDSGAFINDAITFVASLGGGDVLLPPGTCIIETSIILKSKVSLIGSGRYVTILKLKNGANTTVIKGENWDTLTGGNTAAGIYAFGLRNFSIDGNKANNASGHGVAIYGYSFNVENVDVGKCVQHGWVTEWTTGTDLPTTTDGSMDAHVFGLRVHDCGDIGVNWNGPHDSVLVNVDSWLNGSYGILANVGSLGSQFTNCHSWGASQTHAWGFAGIGCVLTNCVGEGASVDQVQIAANDTFLFGCYIYAGGSSGNGIDINAGAAGCKIDAKLSGFSGNALDLTGDVGLNVIDVMVWQTTGTIIGGTPHATTRLTINYAGGAALGITYPTVFQGAVAGYNTDGTLNTYTLDGTGNMMVAGALKAGSLSFANVEKWVNHG